MGTHSLFPANDEIRIINRDNGDLIRTISLPGKGSRMTPAVWKDKILSVDQEGTLSIINSGSGSVEKEITTMGTQPIALSITVKNNVAVFSGRKGSVVCVDLNAGKVLWEKQLSDGENKVQVYSDIVCSDTGAYIYAKGLIFGLDLDSGNDLFEVVRNVSSPPAIIDDSLVFGLADSTLVFMDPSSGNIRESLSLEEPVSTRPAPFADKIAVGTSRGKIIIINPEGIR
ncbi:MAG: PQQ-binding-like beta-propeller repeat protein [Spirochaetales bacterium]|nr:PQQ-binding-like beta-propeller repeat protein [Spirochaetales bacterium]